MDRIRFNGRLFRYLHKLRGPRPDSWPANDENSGGKPKRPAHLFRKVRVSQFHPFGASAFDLSGASFIYSLSGQELADWLIFAAEAAVFYFYIFNKGTRQSLHDLAAGTYVVDVQPGGAVEAPQFWRKHWAIFAAIFAAGALFVAVFGSAIQDTPYPELNRVQQAVLASGKAQSVAAQVQKTWRNGHSQTGMVISVVWRGTRTNAEEDATEIADVVLRNDSNAANRDYITVVFQNGFAVGFARFSNNRQVSHDPATWSQLAQNLGLH